MKKDGKQLEQIVHLIEQSISPNAKVEHDVDMPILNSNIGATTQCDVVIRSGERPRQTVTIVEVQDRNSKVKPNDFRGWRKKLEDVGAQHLICVSRQEFPKSIKEQALDSGNSIILITFKETNPDNLPIDFVTFNYQYSNFQITALNKVQPTISKSEAVSLGIRDTLLSKDIINSNELCWSLDKNHLVSLYLLCRDYYQKPEDLTEGAGTINFDIKKDPSLYYSVNGIFIRSGLNCEFEWTHEIISQPVSVFSYEENEFGTMAWVVEIFHDSPKGKIVLRIPIIKSDDYYIIRSVHAEIPEDVDLTMGRK